MVRDGIVLALYLCQSLIGCTIKLELDTSYYQVAWTTENPGTLERELASLRAIKDSTPKYLITTDIDFNPVYDGIRKLNVIDWLLSHNINNTL